MTGNRDSKTDSARGTGGLRRPTRLLAWFCGGLGLLLFPAVATAATQAQSPAIGVGVAFLTLLAMIAFAGVAWRRFARQIRRATRPRWEDWG